MNLALVSNSIGVMWVAVELATLTTVLMVGIYPTPEQWTQRVEFRIRHPVLG